MLSNHSGCTGGMQVVEAHSQCRKSVECCLDQCGLPLCSEVVSYYTQCLQVEQQCLVKLHNLQPPLSIAGLQRRQASDNRWSDGEEH